MSVTKNIYHNDANYYSMLLYINAMFISSCVWLNEVRGSIKGRLNPRTKKIVERTVPAHQNTNILHKPRIYHDVTTRVWCAHTCMLECDIQGEIQKLHKHISASTCNLTHVMFVPHIWSFTFIN